MKSSKVKAGPLPTLAELAAGEHGPTLDVSTSSRLVGISPSHGYNLIARGEFPCRVIRAGGRYRVVTASLVALLTEPATRENA